MFDHVTPIDAELQFQLTNIKHAVTMYMQSQSAAQRIVGLAVLSSWWHGISVSIAYIFVQLVMFWNYAVTFFASLCPLNAKLQEEKLWMIILIVNGLTRPGIEPLSTVSVADALSIQPRIGAYCATSVAKFFTNQDYNS